MDSIFHSVLAASFWGGCLTVLFLLVNKLCKRVLPVSWHYYIWIIVLIRLFMPTVITIPVEGKEIPFVNQRQGVFEDNKAKENVSMPYYFADNLMQEVYVGQDGKQENRMSIVSQGQAAGRNLIDSNNVWVIWFGIALVLGFHKAISYLCYVRRIKLHNVLPSEAEMDIFLKQRSNMGIVKNVRFFKNGDVTSPLAMGLLKPTIILPDQVYTATQFIYICRHELTHIKGYDIVFKWICELAKSIHWFNPLVYVATKKACEYCEISCDGKVLKNSGLEERQEYGMTLIDVIGKGIDPKTPMCVSMGSGRKNLKNRINYILNIEKKKSVVLTFIITMIMVLSCACSGVKLETKGMVSQEGEKAASAKNIVNVLIAGMDSSNQVDGRADVIMIASFNTVTNKISLMSIPRDTYVVPSQETALKLKQQGITVPEEMKMGELTAYGNGNSTMELLQAEVENMFDIPLDYYVKMNMVGFEKIVDAVGGIEMDIPSGGLYYSDPAQNLEIAIDEGVQHLNGNKALQLVRYRKTYTNGDLDRIKLQQQFVRELFKKIVGSDNLLERFLKLG